MAIFATLKFGSNDSGRYNREYPVLSVRGHFLRDNNSFMPESSARCERLTVTLPVPPRTDLTFYEWFSQRSIQSGCIEFTGCTTQGTNSTRILKFDFAKCFSLSENYDIDNQKRLLLTIGIVAEKVETDGVEFDRY